MNSPNGEPTSPAPANDRTMQILAHLSPLAGCVIPFAHLLAPFVFWLLKKDSEPQLRPHLEEVLNFQISISIYFAVCFVLVFVLIGIPLMFLVGGFALVCIVLGAVKASNGELFHYPLCIRFIK